MSDNAIRPMLDAASRAAILLRRERFARLLSAFTGLPLTLARKVFRPLPARRAGAFRRVCLPILALAVIAPAAATAQSGSLGAWGGVFTPLQRNPDVGTVGTSIRRDNSFVGGGRLTFWGSNVLGLEAVAGFSPAHVRVAGALVNGERDTEVFVGGLKLMVGLSPSLSPVGFHVGAGPALIRRGKDATDPSRSETDLGGVIGAGIRLPISSALGLRIDGEDFLYGGDFGGGKDFTNDLVLSAGLHLNFGGR